MMKTVVQIDGKLLHVIESEIEPSVVVIPGKLINIVTRPSQGTVYRITEDADGNKTIDPKPEGWP